MFIAHTADWHLAHNLLYGHQNLTVSPGLARLQEIKQHAIQVIDSAVNNGCKILVICGDVFNHFNPDNRSQYVLGEIVHYSVHKKLPVRIISGDHDYNGKLCSLDNIKVLLKAIPHPALRIITPTESKFEFEILDSNHIAYYVPWQKDFKNAVLEVRRHMKSHHGIRRKMLFTHIDVAGVKMSNGHTLPEAAVKISDFNSFSLTLLGNFHNNQIFGPKNNIAYSGSITKLNFGEMHNQVGYNLVDTDKLSIKLMPVKDISMKILEFDDKKLLNWDKHQAHILNGINNDTVIKLLVSTQQNYPVQLGELQQFIRKQNPRQLITQISRLGNTQDQTKLAGEILASPVQVWKGYVKGKSLSQEILDFGLSALKDS